MANITIEALATSLKRAPITYAKDIAQKMRQDNEWEKYAKPRKTLHTYTAPIATVTDVLQAYQCDWTPKGGVNFDSVDNTLHRIKFDYEITCEDMEVLYETWLAEWYEMYKDSKDWAFTKYIFTEVILPKLVEEQNNNYYNGVAAVITPGTATTSIGSMTGLKKKIADYITAGKLVPIVTGAITSANIVDKVEAMQDALPPIYQKAGGNFYMSQTMANWYWRDYRGSFGTGNGILGNPNDGLKIDNSNKNIIGMASMEGSQRIIYSPNLIWGSRTGEPYLPQVIIDTEIRKVKLSMVYSRFIGFEYFFNTFVNDQA